MTTPPPKTPQLVDGQVPREFPRRTKVAESGAAWLSPQPHPWRALRGGELTPGLCVTVPPSHTLPQGCLCLHNAGWSSCCVLDSGQEAGLGARQSVSSLAARNRPTPQFPHQRDRVVTAMSPADGSTRGASHKGHRRVTGTHCNRYGYDSLTQAPTAQRDGQSDLALIIKDTEAQRGQTTQSRWHSWRGAEPGLEPEKF